MSEHRSLLLEAQALTGQRGGRALFHALSFTVSVGDVFQVLGPNASGKTTLLRQLVGLLPVHEGSVERHSDVFYLGHSLGLKLDFTVLENIRHDPRRLCLDASQSAQLLEDWGLLSFKDHPVRSLSRGQRQRLGLVKMILSSAPLWVLDEPFSNLDAEGAALLESYLHKKTEKRGILLSTHHVISHPSVHVLDLLAC